MVEVTGEAGRTFQVQWEQFEEESGLTSGTSEWFSESIKLDQLFQFDNESTTDIHYSFTVIDNKGCTADTDTLTFDQIITAALELTVTKGEVGTCTTDVTITAAGGVAPYVIMVDDEVVSEDVVMLSGGTYMISVTDAHQCMAMEEVTIDFGTTRDTTIDIYAGDTAQFVDAAAALDTMLVGGDYTFYYDVDTACMAELNVTVTERERTAPVVDTMTPQDTIDHNHPDFVITFVDEVWFGEGGNLVVTEKDSTEATLTLALTEDMVDGNVVTVTYDYLVSGALKLNTTYVVTVDSAAIMGDGLVWDGVADNSWMFTTGEVNFTSVDSGAELEDITFSVYPNPFTSFIRIDNYDKLTRVVLTNIAGQRVLDIEYPSYEIRTGNLVTGVYVVTLIADGEIVKSERIIKR
jgi:hypothetical protein